MKKSKVLMFVNFVVIILFTFIVVYSIEITKYVMSVMPYDSLSIGEILSCYDNVLTYLFEIGILSILCIIYKKQRSKNIEEKEVKSEPAVFVWEDQRTDIVELEKKLTTIDQKIDRMNAEKPIDKSKVKTSTAKKTNVLSKAEEKQIQKELNKAIEKYENKKKDPEVEDLEKELDRILSNHTAKDPKVPTTRMTKDELLKCAAWNDVYVIEDMTKAEIMAAINKKIKPQTKSKKK